MEIWRARPNDEQIKVRINEFMTALAAADLQRSFQICPCAEFDPSDHDAMFEHLEHSMYLFIGGGYIWDGIDDGNGGRYGDGIDVELTKPSTWLSSVTPPAELAYEGLELAVVGDEVLANVCLDGVVSEIACRYRLEEIDGQWRLAFESFDVL